jgi:hypothetical protein
MLVGCLAFPWAVHTLVVGVSTMGGRPLGSRGFAAVILLTATAAAALAAYRLRRDAGAGPAERATVPLLRAVSAVLVAGALGAFTGALLLAVALPVVAYDALAYRLPAIAEWLDAGRVAWLVTDDPVRNGYPLGQEAVAAVFAAATRSMRFVAVPSFFYVGAGALATALFAESVGVRRPLARAAGALFVLVPMVILNAPSGYVDASFGGAAVAFVLLSALAVGPARGDRAVAALAGIAAAHTLSLKGTGVALVVAVTAVIAAREVLARLRPGPSADAGTLTRALGLAACFALPGAFWVLRNVAHTGNPLWPVDVRVAGHGLFAGVASMESVLDVAHNTPAVLAPLSEPARLLRTWFESAGPATDFDARLAGLGLCWPLVAVPAIVFTAFRVARGQVTGAARSSLAVALCATALAFALQPMRWWPRYTIWLWGIGAVAILLSVEWLVVQERRRVGVALLAAVTGLALAEGGVALFHANGLATAVAAGGGLSHDPRRATNSLAWVDDAFWHMDVAHAAKVCRGAWKPGTDDANLDGVLAQLSPRPSVHVVPDDDGDWVAVARAWKEAGCTDLLLLRGSPVLPLALEDPSVSVEPAVAFDPLFVVRPRGVAHLDLRNVTE